MDGKRISTQIQNLIVRDIKTDLSQRNIAKNYEVRRELEQIRRKFQSTGLVADRSRRAKNIQRENTKIVREVKKKSKDYCQRNWRRRRS